LFAQSQSREESKTIADHQEGSVLNLGGVSLLSDTQGVEFGSYLTAWKKATQATWEGLIPQEAKAPKLRKGVVVIRFKILPSGHIMDGSMVLESRSGSTPLDSAAWYALTGSRYSPLPSEFLGPYLELRTVFSYNQGPKS
jgi:TonB family protein